MRESASRQRTDTVRGIYDKLQMSVRCEEAKEFERQAAQANDRAEREENYARAIMLCDGNDKDARAYFKKTYGLPEPWLRDAGK